MSIGYRQRQEQIGPWILAAAVVHAIALVVGFVVALEFQKMQMRDALKEVRQSAPQRFSR